MVGGMLKRIGDYDGAYDHYERVADLLPRNLYALAEAVNDFETPRVNLLE